MIFINVFYQIVLVTTYVWLSDCVKRMLLSSDWIESISYNPTIMTYILYVWVSKQLFVGILFLVTDVCERKSKLRSRRTILLGIGTLL